MMGLGGAELFLIALICAVVGGGLVGFAALAWLLLRKKSD